MLFRSELDLGPAAASPTAKDVKSLRIKARGLSVRKHPCAFGGDSLVWYKVGFQDLSLSGGTYP